MAQSSKSVASLRLLADLKLMRKEASHAFSASPLSDENLFIWSATIFGLPETAWEGGAYGLCLTFNKHYPEKPPQVRFTGEIFHPNVFKDGIVCLENLQEEWSPVYTVSTLLMSIRSLLNDPNPSSPANVEAADLYIADRNAYKKKVRRCAEKSVEF